MAQQNIFERWGPWKTAFIFSAIFIALTITSNIAKPINQDITKDITHEFVNKLVESCGLPESQGGAGFIGTQLERCRIKMVEGSELKNIKLVDCRGCGKTEFGENQLCLIGEDADFCEQAIHSINQARTQGIAQLGSSVKSFTNFFDNISSQNSILIWIVGLSILGFFIGGGRIGLDYDKK